MRLARSASRPIAWAARCAGVASRDRRGGWIALALIAGATGVGGCGGGEKPSPTEVARLHDLVREARIGLEGGNADKVSAALGNLRVEIARLAAAGAFERGEAILLLAGSKTVERRVTEELGEPVGEERPDEDADPAATGEVEPEAAEPLKPEKPPKPGKGAEVAPQFSEEDPEGEEEEEEQEEAEEEDD